MEINEYLWGLIEKQREIFTLHQIADQLGVAYCTLFQARDGKVKVESSIKMLLVLNAEVKIKIYKNEFVLSKEDALLDLKDFKSEIKELIRCVTTDKFCSVRSAGVHIGKTPTYIWDKLNKPASVDLLFYLITLLSEKISVYVNNKKMEIEIPEFKDGKKVIKKAIAITNNGL